MTIDTTRPTPLLDIRELSISYSSGAVVHRAVSGADLSIGAGEIVALVGESGSGKTTIGNAVLGLLPEGADIDGGSILFEGRELLSLTEKEMSRLRGSAIAYVPQDPGASLDPVQSIGAQLVEGFRLHGAGLSRAQMVEKAVELLDLVGIDRPRLRLRQYPHELSGGMRQRVLIAIAFALNPRLLIADEPTSALDVTVQRHVLDLFESLVHEFDTSVLFVTHDLVVATDRASRVLVMQSGRIVEADNVEQIVTRPRHEYTRLLLDAAVPPAEREREQPAAGSPLAIVAEDLSRTFRSRRRHSGVTAVNSISFSVPERTTFALVGQSGSGKSTTARLILGLTRPTAGSLEVNGMDLSGDRATPLKELWRNVQLVHQNPYNSLDPRLSVGRILDEPLREFGMRSRAERARRVAELVEQVALPSAVLRRRSTELSGGQRQRVALARALAPGARILVLDEALSALDVITRSQILDLLARLQREQELTYVFISHDLEIVQRISHTVAVMLEGRIVESGPTAAVFANPEHEFTRELLDSAPGHTIARLRSLGSAAEGGSPHAQRGRREQSRQLLGNTTVMLRQ